ncbi:MAG: response regulator [Alphaproteobacteria bacterium]|nr:response regulator [Alphaproteobacteria bacterium]
MTMRSRSVAILAANSAFTSILANMLEVERGHRVACFSDAASLSTYLILTPVDVVALDLETPDGQSLIQQVRRHPKLANPFVSILTFTRANPAFHRPLRLAGADLVLQKPVAPARLLAAVDGLMEGEQQAVVNWSAPSAAAPMREAASPSRNTDNVVSLFGNAPIGQD